jgi:hypothetical protein
MTPSEIIVEARKLLQDTRVPFRYSDADLLGYLNQAILRVLTMRPDLFTEVGDLTLVPNTVVQNLPSDGHRLVDLYYVKGGGAVTEVNRVVFERSHPNWAQDPAGPPVNYMRHPRNPTTFFVYPQPATSTEVVAEYVAVPTAYTLVDTITHPSAGYFSTLVDGVVFLASSIDDEHVNSGRAQLFQQSFMQALGTDLQSRTVTDQENMPAAEQDRRRR